MGPPNDDARGGVGTFIFSEQVTIDYVEILDQDDSETAEVFLYSDREATPANLVAQFSTEPLGDNSFQRLAIDTSNVLRMDVRYDGSGALAALAYTAGEPTAVSLSALGASSSSGPFMPLLLALVLLTGMTAFWLLPFRRI